MKSYPTSQRASTPLKVLVLVVLLMGQVLSQTQYGCQLVNGDCGEHGSCERFGFCTCNEGYYGEKCENKMKNSTLKTDLSKGFITFWVIFWILLNFLIPYLICLMITYLQKKNCDRIKEHFNDLREAFCCCIKKKEDDLGHFRMNGENVALNNPEKERSIIKEESPELVVPAIDPVRDEQKPQESKAQTQPKTVVAPVPEVTIKGSLPPIKSPSLGKPIQEISPKKEPSPSLKPVTQSNQGSSGLLFNNKQAVDLLGPKSEEVESLFVCAVDDRGFKEFRAESDRLLKLAQGHKLYSSQKADKLTAKLTELGKELKVDEGAIAAPKSLKDQLIWEIKFK